jgi:hypothetical protein
MRKRRVTSLSAPNDFGCCVTNLGMVDLHAHFLPQVHLNSYKRSGKRNHVRS